MNLYEIENSIVDLMENAVDPETGEIDESCLAQLEELQMAKDKKIENIGCYIKNLKADAEALKNEKMALAKRQQLAENKAERLKEYLIGFLDGEKFKSPRVEVSYRKSTSVECEDIFKVPEMFLKVKEPEVDKMAVKEALKNGETVEGCRLIEKVSAQIK